MRVALVHDYLTQMGGAERVLLSMMDMYPTAPVYTLIYDEEATRGHFRDRDVRTSFLQRMPFSRSKHRLYPPLMPTATEGLDLRGFDLVVSSSWSFTKGVLCGPETTHVSFCHTPLRYAWDDSHRYVSEFRSYPKMFRRLAQPALTYLRLWDHAAAQRPDLLLANSSHVAKRIKKYYGRDARVVYPPVRTEMFNQVSREPGDAFLMAGRLMAYKRFDLGILAAHRAGVPLRIVGVGPEMRNLKRLAQGKDVTFLGGVSDGEFLAELGRAKGFLFPQEEDFGIVAVEALAAGVPLIAYRAGGAGEFVKDGINGCFIETQDADELATKMMDFDISAFDTNRMRQDARRFSESAFSESLLQVVEDALSASR